MDLELAAAYWSLGQLASDKLPEIATDALVRGLDSYSLRILSGERDPILAEVGPRFEKSLSELGIAIPGPYEAGMKIAHHYARSIVSGVIAPYEGAKIIWHEVFWELDGPEELRFFVGAFSEYEDFMTAGSIEFYGKRRCIEVRRDIEVRIVEKAKKLIAQT